jgi:hypothetical protein
LSRLSTLRLKRGWSTQPNLGGFPWRMAKATCDIVEECNKDVSYTEPRYPWARIWTDVLPGRVERARIDMIKFKFLEWQFY